MITSRLSLTTSAECGSELEDKDWLRRHNVDRLERWIRVARRSRAVRSKEVRTSRGRSLRGLLLRDGRVRRTRGCATGVLAPCPTATTIPSSQRFVSHNTEARLSRIRHELLPTSTRQRSTSAELRRVAPAASVCRRASRTLLVNGSAASPSEWPPTSRHTTSAR